MGLGSWARVGAEQTKRWQIAGFSPKLLSFINTITFEVCGVRNLVYLFLYITPLHPTQKLEKYITIYIRRLISLEIFEPDFFFVSLIAMFVVKKTGFKIGQQKISPSIITGLLYFQ